uniref:Uncharacterized protein n=1 Tax=Tanacetum cinerariifolium TaxID=118510 RepID=A0A699H5T9_TANCI|nr:hypothetical protein [Tanacetum cinerariifolium]
MDDSNTTMEEYVRLESERALRNGKVYNRETTTYELSSVPTVSPQHVDEVNLDFKISFAESDDDDYTSIYDHDSFSYKLISVNDLKSDTDNDNGKFDIKQSLEDVFIEPSHNVISIDVGTSQYGVSSDMDMAYRLPV